MPSINVEDSDSDNTAQQPEVTTPVVPETPAPAVPGVMVKKSGASKLLWLIIGLLVLALMAGVAYLVNDRKQLKQEVNKLSQAKQVDPNEEAKQLSAEVGKLIELPSDEVPTVATVVDAEKVKNQAFFAKAQNGDKVLLYAKAGKAILYRPSTKKVIEVAPINLNNTQGQQGSETTGTTDNR